MAEAGDYEDRECAQVVSMTHSQPLNSQQPELQRVRLLYASGYSAYPSAAGYGPASVGMLVVLPGLRATRLHTILSPSTSVSRAGSVTSSSMLSGASLGVEGRYLSRSTTALWRGCTGPRRLVIPVTLGRVPAMRQA
jgi:hypothetical protein